MTVRIRFSLAPTGRGISGIEQATRSAAAVIAQNVAIEAGEDAYKDVVADVQTSFARDARAELAHVAYLYRRQVIGAGMVGGTGRPRGTLAFRLPESEAFEGYNDDFSAADMLPEWAPRSPKYMAEKRRRGWGQQWFRARRELFDQMQGPNLEAAYGGVRVSVIRNLKVEGEFSGLRRLASFGGAAATPLTKNLQGNVGRGTHIRMNVATIRVYAMEKITPSMLPGLRDGVMNRTVSDDPGRGRSFLAPIKESGQLGLYHRLARTSYQGKYRATLEPYLTWYLTKSIPNAIAYRLEEGRLGAKARSSAGRTRR